MCAFIQKCHCAFLDLVHLGVTLTGTFLGGAGGCDQGGIDHRARLEHQALGGQGGVDGAQQLQAKVMFFEQVANPQDGGFVGQSGDASIEPCKLTVQRGVMRGFFHGGVRQPTPMLLGKCTRSMVATANGGHVRLACEAPLHPSTSSSPFWWTIPICSKLLKHSSGN